MAKVIPDGPKPDQTHLPVLKESDDVASIHLSGTAFTEAGKLTKHNYFKFLNLDIDDYTDISYTEEEALKIRGHLAKMSTGHTSMVPMICSPKCSFRDRCLFYKMNKAPYGRSCLWEVNLLREWTTSYFEQYEIDPNNFTEVGMINELAEIEIYLWRLSMQLARPENAELIQENIVGFTPQGSPLTVKQVSVALDAKEKLYNRKAKIVKLMVGDRQEKYKREAALKVREESDPSSSMAELRTRLERLSRDVRKRELQIAEDSGQIVDVDSKLIVEKAPAAVSAEDLMNSIEE